MACFAVGYELRHESELARRRFCDEVERLGGVEVVRELYLIELDGSIEEVMSHLRKFLADRDRLLVIAFDRRPAMQAPLMGAEAWVAERFTPDTQSPAPVSAAAPGTQAMPGSG